MPGRGRSEPAPLTRLTHSADYQFFGMESGWRHRTNVWLLFAVLKRVTGARWPPNEFSRTLLGTGEFLLL